MFTMRKFYLVTNDARSEWHGRTVSETGELFDDFGPFAWRDEERARLSVTSWACQDWDCEVSPEDVILVVQEEMP